MKRTLIILFLTFSLLPTILAGGSEPFIQLPNDAVLLYDGWKMRESAICGNLGERFSTNNFAATDWYSTTVPATALGVLVNHGVYPDPYIGMNVMQIPDASPEFNEKYGLTKYTHLPNNENPWEKPYWFRNEFQLPTSYSGKTVWLNLDGINYRADVWLNGQLVAGRNKLVGMFHRFRLDVSDYVTAGEKNTLAVCIYPLDHPGDPVHAQIDGFSGQLGPNGGDAEISRDLTMYCTVGWDWIPQVPDRNIGFWQHVWLNATEAVRVTDPAVFTDLDLPDLSKADLKIRFYAQNASSKAQKTIFEAEISPNGFVGETIKLSKKITLAANTRTEIIFDSKEFPQLILKNPKIWYPVGYGEQPLYNINIKAFTGKTFSSQETRRFGVREFSSYLLESGGRAFEVNGVTVRMSGGAWVPDMMLTWDAQRYRDEVRLMAAGNATFVRINGCGIIMPDVFLDACDEAGLLVWQDLIRTTYSPDYRKVEVPKNSGYYWYPTPADSTLYMNNMVDAIEKLRGHAAFYLYCGSNEATPQENTGVALQNKVLPEMDGTRMFIASSHEQPGWANTKIGMTTGGPWDMQRLPWYYNAYRNDSGFTGRNEIGLTSPPTINTLLKSLPDYDRPEEKHFPLNRDMGFHDATGWAMQSLDRIMREDMGNPANITEYLWWGDLYNSASYRAIFEAANSARPRNAGTMLWKTNAAWSSFNWQLYDWYLRPNAGFYSSQSALQPIHIQLDVDDLNVKLINALPQKLENYSAKITIYSSDGKMEQSLNFNRINAEINANSLIANLSEWLNDDRLYFVEMTLVDSKNAWVDKTTVWYQREMKWHELTKIAPANIEVDFISVKTEGDEMIYSFNLRNMSSVPAVNVFAELINGYQGLEILPSFWSDNALTLMPNERKQISVRVRKSSILKPPHLLVEGLNVSAKEWNIAEKTSVPISIKVSDFELVIKENKKQLAFSVQSEGNFGERINTFRIPVKVNGKLLRYVLIGCKSGGTSEGLIDVNDLQPETYQVEIGGLSKTLMVE